MIDKAPRGGNHNFNSTPKVTYLPTLGYPTVDNGVLDFGRRSKFIALFLDLYGQFTGGRQDKNNRTLSRLEVGLHLKEAKQS